MRLQKDKVSTAVENISVEYPKEFPAVIDALQLWSGFESSCSKGADFSFRFG